MATGKTLSDAIQKLIDNVEDVAVVSANLVKDKMQKDFEKMAEGTVDKYYEYQKGYYTKHGRKHNLYKTYSVDISLIKTKKRIDFDLSLKYDPDVLEGLYHSNASETWADVQADYVLENFLGGYHPWTNGWPLFTDKPLQYKEIKGSPSVKKTFNQYKKTYGDKYFSKYMDKVFMQLIKVYL